ncbi:hypothetical protein JCM10207_009242 [Rhodosporidiobolus poonsookiae]
MVRATIQAERGEGKLSGPDYSNKASAQIIDEQAASLNAKTRDNTWDTARTDLSDNSGVNESGLEGFPGASVEVGRTGYSGGGDNMTIPVEHGGDPRTNGSRASAFESHVPAGEDERSWQAKTQPGSINVSGQREEALRSTDAPADGQPQLGEQRY